MAAWLAVCASAGATLAGMRLARRPRPPTRPARRHAAVAAVAGRREAKLFWVEPTTAAAATAALEAGAGALLFPKGAALAEECASLARFDAVFRDGDALTDAAGNPLGVARTLATPADAAAAARDAARADGVVLVDPTDWAVIPVENLVAAFQNGAGADLLVTASTCASALVALGALDGGADGVVLRTGAAGEVRALAAALARQAPAAVELTLATIVAVTPAGMGDRVCVDMTSLLGPGEGLLVGSFATGAVLVASERDPCGYVAPRPFRVNAGAVHCYVDAPGGKTAYLAELGAGAEVLVVGPTGSSHAAVVGRAKVEARPLLRVDAVAVDGVRVSVMLQNAETVRLVAPQGMGGGAVATPPPAKLSRAGSASLEWVMNPSDDSDSDGDPPPPAAPLSADGGAALAWALGPGPAEFRRGVPPTPAAPPPPPAVAPKAGAARAALDWLLRPRSGGVAAAAAPAHSPPPSWRTVSVADLQPGDTIYVRRGAAGRHTGIAVEERVVER